MKKLILLSSLFWCAHVSGQVIITLQLPPMGLTIKPQLWNLSLVNSSSLPVTIKIELVMTDASTNQQVMTGTTNQFILPVGVKQLRLNDVMPITYNVTGSGYAIDATPNGFLPVGLFHFCYIVTKIDTDAPERLGEECETVEVEPLSPPQLVLPSDNERIETTRPIFTWLPPSPFSLFNNLNYEWKLVEVMPTQSGADAIVQNIPLLSQNNLTAASFQYPLAMAELDTSKLYAWRVTAKNSIAFVANSEVWTFRVRLPGESRASVPGSAYYSKLRRQIDPSYILAKGTLRFEYKNEINTNHVRIDIYDLSSGTRKELVRDSVEQRVVFGTNYIQLDLTGYRVKAGHIYLMELTNVKGEKWYLKFEYRKPD